MYRFIIAGLVALMLAGPALAQRPVVQQRAPATETPLKTQLNEIFGKLAEQVKTADALAGRLREVAQAKPEDMQREVAGAADNIGKLADMLSPNGQIAGQLAGIRNTAATHRKRVEEDKDNLDEADRGKLMDAWEQILIESDKAQSTVTDMRSKLVNALQRLRKRQTAISELMLAGQYQAALASLNAWLGDLQATVNGLHQSIDQMGNGLGQRPAA